MEPVLGQAQVQELEVERLAEPLLRLVARNWPNSEQKRLSVEEQLALLLELRLVVASFK